MNEMRIAIIGLGYVGLPLAIEFGKKYRVLGYDISQIRVDELLSGIDETREADPVDLKSVTDSWFDYSHGSGLMFTSSLSDIKDCNVFIVTVPTPINQSKEPDLGPLESASRMIGGLLKKGDIVIYESTVYPGCTEEICVPILQTTSGLIFNKDFFCGYSPERINPGDKVNTLTKIMKVTSGSTPSTAEMVDGLYGSIIVAGTHKASSIKVAEASKAIENAQRDLNISFINELALMFDVMGIDTTEVLEAAGTKWNFLKFKPGLVGGHCIGVDPYYLTFKARSLGYTPQVILSGRTVNERMGAFIAQKVIMSLVQRAVNTNGLRALILGFTFKENCSDIRNSKVIDIYNELLKFNVDVEVFDPLANHEEVWLDYGVRLVTTLSAYDIIILAVSHDEFRTLSIERLKKSKESYVFDCKSVLPREIVDGRL